MATSQPSRLADIPVPPVDLSRDLRVLERRLKRAFVARYGPEIGSEVTADALAWAWANRDQVQNAANPMGLLFRVGQSKSRRYFRWSRRERSTRFPPERAGNSGPTIEPGLDRALADLGPEHRTAIVLHHCFQWTYREIAELMETDIAAVRNRINRGMKKLRTALEVD